MSQLKDLTGRLFGFLSVQKRVANYVQENGRKRTRWLCICLLCGKTCIMDGSHLLHGNVISCGCLRNMKSSQRMTETKGKPKKNSRSVDLTGKILNENLLVEKLLPVRKNTKKTYLVKCLLCGTEFEARANHIVRGLIRSCGCVYSFGEKYIKNYLNEHNVKYKPQYWFNDFRSPSNKPYPFDFGFLDNESRLIALLEYQGDQHDSKRNQEFGKQQRETTDRLKKEYCTKNHIKLYEIWYYQDIETELNKIIDEISHVNPVPSLTE